MSWQHLIGQLDHCVQTSLWAGD